MWSKECSYQRDHDRRAEKSVANGEQRVITNCVGENHVPIGYRLTCHRELFRLPFFNLGVQGSNGNLQREVAEVKVH